MALATLLLFAHLAGWISGWLAVILFIVLLPVFIGIRVILTALIADSSPPAAKHELKLNGNVTWVEFMIIVLYLLELVAAPTAFWIVLGWMMIQALFLIAFAIIAARTF